ncbi:hypothetical protein [Brevundimonas sp.]|uniref:hypothetical protein n=1 Tax=Brevundimonas sp. TaxID=1871086 RepID=UPI0028AEE99D|nr:hypothetical protein [Brevundimonas sp.]
MIKYRAIAYVRERVVKARVFSEIDNACELVARAQSPDGETHVLPSLGSDPRSDNGLNDLERALSPKVREKINKDRLCRDYQFLIPDGLLCVAISLVAHCGESKVDVQWAARDAGLAYLLPMSRNDFREYFSFRFKRHKVADTALFVSEQVLTRSAKSPDTRTPETLGYICNAFVIYLYKSIETNTYDATDTRLFLSEALSALDEMPPTGGGVREDRHHLQISMKTALWHYYVFFGMRPSALIELNEIYSLYKSTERFVVTYGYNYAKSLLMCGVIRYVSGDVGGAQAAWDASIEAFKRSVAIGTRNVTWFSEMADSHAAATASLRLSEAVSSSSEISQKSLCEAANTAARVSDNRFCRSIQSMISLSPLLSGQEGNKA